MSYHEWLSSNLSLSIYLPVYLTSQNSLVCFGTGSGLTEARVSRTRSRARTSRTHLVRLSPRASSYVRTVIRRFSAVPRTHRPDRTWWRTVQDSNPRLRLRRPEGYPDYPNGPRLLPAQSTHIQSDGWQSTTSLDRLLWTLTGIAECTFHPHSVIFLLISPQSSPITWS